MSLGLTAFGAVLGCEEILVDEETLVDGMSDLAVVKAMDRTGACFITAKSGAVGVERIGAGA